MKTKTRPTRANDAMKRGEELAAMARADRYLKDGAKYDPADLVVHRAANGAVRSAQRQLRAASIAAIGVDDWESARAVDEALEAVERAHRRALALGIQPEHPYRDGSHSFFHDVFAVDNGSADTSVRGRLSEFQSLGQIRAIAPTTSFNAPAFLVSQYADVPRQSRVLAGLIPTGPLPKGSTLSIPQLSASVTVGSVAPNTAPTESASAFADAFDAQTIGWIAARLTTSMQVFEQSWNPQFEEVAATLLTGAFDEDLESQIYVGTGSSQQILGVLNASNLVTVTNTDASPTPVKLTAVIGQALAKYARARKATATAILMSPERWAWIAAGEDSTGRSLLNVTGPADAKVAGGLTPVGSIHGVPVYTSTGVPTNGGTGTNQDQILITRPEDQRLYTSTPVFGAYQDTAADSGDLSVVLTFSCSASAFPDRYPSVVIAGTGLVAPSGF